MISENHESGPSIRDFVFQDAIERAFEINIKGIKDYENEKRRIYQQRRETVGNEFERKHKDKLVEKRIHRSSLINKSRMNKMEARNNAIMKTVSIAQHRILKDIVGNATVYKELLKKLIIEGLVKLFEENVIIRCLKRDQAVVQSLITTCKQEYQALLKKELGQDIKVNISVNKNQFLIERQLPNSDTVKVQDYSIEKSKEEIIQKSEEDSKCFGGVILTNDNGLIICKNTLDARVDLAFCSILPRIRSTLFDN